MSARLRLVTMLVALLPAGAQPVLRIPKVDEPPRLEEFLAGGAAKTGARVAGFRQYLPGDGTPVTEETEAWVAYDARSLYIVFVCKDDPARVRARLSRREDIDSDDTVVVNLDTFHDHHRAYTFSVNPLGVQQDYIFTEGQGGDMSFDTLWYSEGRVTGFGYVVWIAIPFKSLRFPRAAVQNWGFALGRSIVRKNEFSTWPHISQRRESYVQQMATLEGLEGISPGRNVQLIPYGAVAQARYLDTAVPAFRSDRDARAGLDAKTVLRDAVSIDVTLNPDFSQVESDEPQVTTNQRFEVFFPERRPFFIENAGFFETPLSAAAFFGPPNTLLFTRRIADPRAGARVTGKAGPWVLGALVADDRRAAVGALRLRRDFAAQSSLGLLVTSRDFGATSNRVLSLDTRWKLNPNWVASGQVMRSWSVGDRGRRTGPACFARLDHSGRHFLLTSRYVDFSPDFSSELGFIHRVDIRRTDHYAAYRWQPEGRRILRIEPSVAGLVNWDRRGRVQDWMAGAGADLELRGQTKISAGHNEDYELFQGVGFRKNSTGVSFSTEWLKWLALRGTCTRARTINYYPARPLKPFAAASVNGEFGLTLRPLPRLRLGETYLYSRLAAPDSTALFNNHILRSRLHCQFTRPLSVRAIVDYNAVLPNTALVALEQSKRVVLDLLVTYLLNPGTALYLGCTERRENLALAPGDALRRTVGPDTVAGRQFFVKLSYLLRF